VLVFGWFPNPKLVGFEVEGAVPPNEKGVEVVVLVVVEG